MASKFMCPEGTADCKYDTIVDILGRIMGYDYIGNLVGTELDGSQMASGNPLSTLYIVVASTILVVMLISLIFMAFLKLYRVGRTGRVGGEEEGEKFSYWTYLKPLMATILVAPVGSYPLAVTLVTMIALWGNGLANRATAMIVERQIDAYHVSDIFGRTFAGSKTAKPKDQKEVGGQRSDIRNSDGGIKTVAATRLLDTNSLQKFAFYGALHGACVNHISKQDYVINPYIRSSTDVYKDGKINITYYNLKDFTNFDKMSAKDVHSTSAWSRFLNPSQKQQFGVIHGFCGTVDFDFFTGEEFEKRYGEFVTMSSQGFEASTSLGSDARANQSERTKAVQGHINTIIQASSGASAQINNLRSAYAVKTYLTAFMLAGGNEVKPQCQAIVNQMEVLFNDHFSNARNSRFIQGSNDGVFKLYKDFKQALQGNSIKQLTGANNARGILTGSVSLGETIKDGKYTYRPTVNNAGSICDLPLYSNQNGWNVRGLDELGTNLTTNTGSSGGTGTTTPATGGTTNVSGDSVNDKAKTFKSALLIELSSALENDLLKRQADIFQNGTFNNDKIKTVIDRAEKDLKRDYKLYMVSRGWANIAEGTILLRNLDNSIKGLYFLPSGSATILTNPPTEEDDNSSMAMGSGHLANYHSLNEDLKGYFEGSMSDFASNGAVVHPSLRTSLNIATQGASEKMMGNVADGIVSTHFINDLQVSLLASMTEGKLQDDPIGAMVSMGNNARMTAFALETAMGTLSSLSGEGQNIGTALATGKLNPTLLVVGGIIDRILDAIRPSMMELIDALKRSGYFLGTIVPTIPSVVMMYAVIGYVMAVFLVQVGVMFWLLLQAHPNPITGTTQQLIVTLLSLFFRPILIVTGFYLSMLLLSAVIGLVFEVWFVSKTMSSSQADGALSEILLSMITFKESFEHLGLLFTGATILCLSWINEFYDSTVSFLGTSLYHSYTDLNTQRIAHAFTTGFKPTPAPLGGSGGNPKPKPNQPPTNPNNPKNPQGDGGNPTPTPTGGGGTPNSIGSEQNAGVGVRHGNSSPSQGGVSGQGQSPTLGETVGGMTMAARGAISRGISNVASSRVGQAIGGQVSRLPPSVQSAGKVAGQAMAMGAKGAVKAGAIGVKTVGVVGTLASQGGVQRVMQNSSSMRSLSNKLDGYARQYREQNS